MNLYSHSPKDIGILGETVTAEYLHRQGFQVVARNARAGSGELDIVAVRKNCLHVVEVKSLRCQEFPQNREDSYDPGENLHASKLKKVVRTTEWYAAKLKWEGEVQIDAALVWLRERDALARIRYYPQIM